jgi:lipoprotein NlpD
VAVPPPPASVVPAPTPAAPPLPAIAIDPRPEQYLVKRGDTLYSIALEHGLDYRELAAMNNIENANVIRVGQTLRVRPPSSTTIPANGSAPSPNGTGSATTAMVPTVPVGEARPLAPPPSATGGALKTQPKAIRLPYSDQALSQVAKAALPATLPEARPEARPLPMPEPKPEVRPEARPAAPPEPRPEAKPEAKPEPKPEAAMATVAGAGEEDRVDWIWPTSGKVIAPFNENANLKGLDIAGKTGQAVLASAAGRVVYAGSGLRGYGKLIIIKHNKTYLSAYAHNKEILIKEGDAVSKGQRIAELGNTDADQPKLHFEIRRFGKPVDPARFLPAAPTS